MFAGGRPPFVVMPCNCSPDHKERGGSRCGTYINSISVFSPVKVLSDVAFLGGGEIVSGCRIDPQELSSLWMGGIQVTADPTGWGFVVPEVMPTGRSTRSRLMEHGAATDEDDQIGSASGPGLCV